jgi:hypothetical protein
MVLLDIKENSKASFFMELVKSLGFIQVVKEVKKGSKVQTIADLAEAFDNVKQFESGKMKLKSAKDLLNEI